MNIMEVIADIEEALTNAKEEKIIYLCKDYFPEEDFGDFSNNGMIDDMYNLILDEIGSNNESAKNIYYFLLNEKIIVDEDEFYWSKSRIKGTE